MIMDSVVKNCKVLKIKDLMEYTGMSFSFCRDLRKDILMEYHIKYVTEYHFTQYMHVSKSA